VCDGAEHTNDCELGEEMAKRQQCERELAEWREMALSQAGDAGLLTRMVKAETEAAFLSAEVDRLQKELDSGGLARTVADVVKRDAYRFRKLLMQGKHWLGVFRCDPDGTPSDSISADELSALLDAMHGPEMPPVPEAP
jgi:hypothetical protein